MDMLITLIYLLFSFCIIYPPTEFVSAGFTITQIFDRYLGSENLNFVGFHMKRMTITALIHSMLPLGYVLSLWCAGENNEWMPFCAILTFLIPVMMLYKIVTWWENMKIKHPVVQALQPYVMEGSDWRAVASNLNTEFRRHVYCIIDKVSIPLQPLSKFIATETWLIKVSQYSMNLIKQSDCSLMAVTSDIHELAPSGEDEVQYLNVEVIPRREDIPRFSFRMTTATLRELQPRLQRPIRLPDHITLLPTLVEKFLIVFKQYVNQNPIYNNEEDPETCIGCMQATADVKIVRRCQSPPDIIEGAPPPCQQCNCKVLWCCTCMGRWWVTRAGGPPSQWLSGRCTCPICRAQFCLLDVSPAVLPPA